MIFGRKKTNSINDVLQSYSTEQTGITEIKKLLQNGVNATLGISDTKGYEPFHVGTTALMLAANWGYDKLCYALLKQGADVNVANTEGFTALKAAIRNNFIDIVKALLNSGADINLVDKYGESALFWATYNTEILKLILDAQPKELNLQSEHYKETALINPSRNGQIEIMRLLLEAGIDPNIPDKGGMRALHWAAQYGQTESIRLLLSYGGDVNSTTKKKITPLISAVIKGNPDAVELLLKSGAGVHAKEKTGWSALTFAEKNGKEDIITILQAYS